MDFCHVVLFPNQKNENGSELWVKWSESKYRINKNPASYLFLMLREFDAFGLDDPA